MVKPLSFKGDKKTKKRKRVDVAEKFGDGEDLPSAKQPTASKPELDAPVDDDSWVTAEATGDVVGPIVLVLPSEPPSCVACDTNGKVFASALENIINDDPSTAEPHDVRQVWVANRVAGTESFTFKGHHGRYLSCDKYGMLSANTEAVSPLESFLAIPTVDTPGTFQIQTLRETFLTIKPSTSSKSSALPEVRGDAEAITFNTTLRIRMQARFKPKLKASKEERAREKISRKELEEAVGRRLEDDEVKKLKKARREGNYHEALLLIKVKNKHDKSRAATVIRHFVGGGTEQLVGYRIYGIMYLCQWQAPAASATHPEAVDLIARILADGESNPLGRTRSLNIRHLERERQNPREHHNYPPVFVPKAFIAPPASSQLKICNSNKMYNLNAISSFRIARPANVYVYDIVPVAGAIAAISSDDSLRLLDPLALHRGPLTEVKEVHKEVTCMQAVESSGLVATAGGDYRVCLWDPRSGEKVWEVRSDSEPILSLATSSPYGLAAGTEMSGHQSSVLIWDIRKTGFPAVQYYDSHCDDITELQFHPTKPHILLSGSTDGLVNIYDTTIEEEEDALQQTINHGSSVHHANFISEHEIFAISHDEKFSIYQLLTVPNPEEQDEYSWSTHHGDMRQKLEVDYVANVVRRPDGGAVMGVGTHSRETFELIQLRKDPPWTFAPEAKVALPGAHGSEIVRSFCFVDSQQIVLTCGEDSQIKAWKGD
ncbi:uncharacterized protein L3040_007398 [Drepanopeziza brunnea f. sp. 'multigermtubi']|uniref:uncharacterized protein n=1 Tax=Drepanopeziza brunnea f. sp. 'multigermtubi' TaxID=698441 RepID=UPI002395DF75|nr:hypothetical protein L3040_007398 [Drepanopeziza brunnea f. sp. 'multigermtubi']